MLSRLEQALFAGAISLSLLSPAYCADDVTRPLQVSPDGHFLMNPNGEPFFYLGENVETLFWILNREDTEFYLQDRAKKGFTVVLGQVVPKYDMDEPNAYGERVFINHNVSRPNPKYFAHIDWVIERAHHYGLRIALAPLLGVTHVTQQHLFTAENSQAWGRWLGQRYRNQGIIWVLGWDTNPIWPDGKLTADNWGQLKVADFRPVYDQFALGVTEGEGGHPFMTFHPNNGNSPGTAEPRTSLYLGGRAWLSMNYLQSGHLLDPPEVFVRAVGPLLQWNSVFNYEPVGKEYESKPARPVIDGEPEYEDLPRNFDKKLAAGRWDSVDIRNSAYHAVFAGAAGHDYNNLNVVGFHTLGHDRPSEDDDLMPNKPWKEALDAPGAVQVGYVKALMLSRPYFSRIPDDSVVKGDLDDGRAHVSATRDRAGSYFMVYLPQGQPVTVKLDRIAGPRAIAWWFDPRTGRADPIETHFETNRNERFIPPSAGVGNDWILVVDDERHNFGPPGHLPGR